MRDYMINLLSFFSSLTNADYVFFGAIILLLVLIIVMFYIIKINYNNDEIKDITLTDSSDVVNSNNVVNPYVEEVLPEDQDLTDEELAIIDLDTLTNKLSTEEASNKTYDSLTEYERMQEEQAIISYDELVNKEQNKLRYTAELEITPDLKVKQVDINSLNEVPSKNSVVININEEESFLQALKMLQNNL